MIRLLTCALVMAFVPLAGCATGNVMAKSDMSELSLESQMDTRSSFAPKAEATDPRLYSNTAGRWRGDDAYAKPSRGLLGQAADLLKVREPEGAAKRPVEASPSTPRAKLRKRKMVYSASYTMLVTTIDDSVAALLVRVDQLGGYLSRRNNASLTVRVPADQFNSLTSDIAKLGRVLDEVMSANDVTDRHTDIAIRLSTAEKALARMVVILEKAEKMSDIIRIEAAIRKLTEEIETMKGRLKLLNDQVAYSTITVSFKANAPKAKPARRRTRSRFTWINKIGISQDLRRF